jgi:hypothetical protein
MRSWVLFGGFAFVALPSAATAGEACIPCTGPAATYRCAVEEGGRLDKISGGDKALAQICIKVLTKTGPHEKCEAGGADEKTCAGGTPKVITLTEFQQALAGGDGYAPDTKVEGVIPGATRVATESLENAGSAISTSARKSWDCVASLFKDC